MTTVYVTGVLQYLPAHLLCGALADATGLAPRDVVDVDRFGDLATLTHLAAAVPSFASSLAALSSEGLLAPAPGVAPREPSFLCAKHR